MGAVCGCGPKPPVHDDKKVHDEATVKKNPEPLPTTQSQPPKNSNELQNKDQASSQKPQIEAPSIPREPEPEIPIQPTEAQPEPEVEQVAETTS